MTLFEVLEIFTHPRDLEITIGCGEDGIYSLLICRGPGHNFKPLISSIPAFSSKEKVIEVIKELLTIAHNKAREVLSNKDNHVTKLVNPGGIISEESPILTLEMVDRIARELGEKNVSSTYLWEKADAKNSQSVWRNLIEKYKVLFDKVVFGS